MGQSLPTPPFVHSPTPFIADLSPALSRNQNLFFQTACFTFVYCFMKSFSPLRYNSLFLRHSALQYVFINVDILKIYGDEISSNAQKTETEK